MVRSRKELDEGNFSLEEVKNGTLQTTEDSLLITAANGESVSVGWNEIDEIHAFKRDLFAVDLVCFMFNVGQRGGLEVNEEMAGFQEMLSWLPRKFPGYDPGWFPKVAFPAFATNHILIWKKGSAAPAEPEHQPGPA